MRLLRESGNASTDLVALDSPSTGLNGSAARGPNQVGVDRSQVRVQSEPLEKPVRVILRAKRRLDGRSVEEEHWRWYTTGPAAAPV